MSQPFRSHTKKIVAISLLIVSISAIATNLLLRVPHPHGSDFKISCSECHTPSNWSVDFNTMSFRHDSVYPLAGAHRDVSCRACHTSLVFRSVNKECFQCHQDVHQQSVSTSCNNCHSETSWLITSVTEIHQNSRFPLVGVHQLADCQDCHTNENPFVFGPLSIECFSCHQKDFITAANPNHMTSGFSQECSDCHSMTALDWGAGFTHAFFPLEKAHQVNECAVCHKENGFAGLSPACNSCHLNEYLGSLNPKHVAAEFSQNCEECHDLTPDWKPTSYLHDYYPLTESHELPSCVECHQADIYKGTNTACFACHESNYKQAENPNHVAGQYDVDCSICHTLAPDWKPAAYDHVNFPLVEGHAVPDCQSCHINEVYTALSTVCISCHQADYEAATDPNHVQAGYGTDCQQCHTLSPDWEPASFNHTSFPLVLGHNGVNCQSCHSSGVYQGLNQDCFSCHQSDYQATTVPPHVSVGFENTCTNCHTLNPGWKPATYNHDFFPLTQGHSLPECTSCHTSGQYIGMNPHCNSCHMDDYNAAVNPNHLQAGFSTNCEECHSTAPGWESSFDHDALYFPIYSGKHQGEWTNCNECHTTGSYSAFSCIGCHEHNQTEMNNEHDDVSGYQYLSSRCLDCHPNGTAEDDKQLYRMRRF